MQVLGFGVKCLGFWGKHLELGCRVKGVGFRA